MILGFIGGFAMLSAILSLLMLAIAMITLAFRKGGSGEPSCGNCGYGVQGLPTFTCPECGSDLRQVGIVSSVGGGNAFSVFIVALASSWKRLAVAAVAIMAIAAIAMYVAITFILNHDVFPSSEVVLGPGSGSYRVLLSQNGDMRHAAGTFGAKSETLFGNKLVIQVAPPNQPPDYNADLHIELSTWSSYLYHCWFAGGDDSLRQEKQMAEKQNPISININGIPQPSRRQAIQWVLGAVAASALPAQALAQEVGRTVTPQENAARQKNPNGKGYGTDPDLLKLYKPGDFWALTFTAEQKKTAAALADTIIPKDALGPAASEVGVPAMIDEWISAPYPDQQAHRPIVLDGLEWIEGEAKKRFNKLYAELDEKQQHAICDDIYQPAAATAEFKKAAGFFSLFRSLAAGAYYATPPGWKAIGYVGNVALASFDGPPAEVLEKLGVVQTVK